MQLSPSWLSPFSGAQCLGWQHCQEPSLELHLLGELTKHLGSIKLLWSPLHIYQTLTTFVFLAAAGVASLETHGFTSLFPFPNSFLYLGFFFFCYSPSTSSQGKEGGEPWMGSRASFLSLVLEIIPCYEAGRSEAVLLYSTVLLAWHTHLCHQE